MASLLTAEEAYRAAVEDMAEAKRCTMGALEHGLISKPGFQEYYRKTFAKLYEDRVRRGELLSEVSATRTLF